MRQRMALASRPHRTPRTNYFPVPNEVFLLGLSPGELSVYSYLIFCADRKTNQCWPSYQTIGRATHMSKNTVRKYVCALADRGLIATEETAVITRNGLKRNGNLKYTILPIQCVVDEYYQRQLQQAELDAQRRRSLERQEEYNRCHPTAALCASVPVQATPDPFSAT